MTTQPEAPDPALTARLEDLGVPVPERQFNALVDEFAATAKPRGAPEELGACSLTAREAAS